jgi:tRNA 2-thiouridine synthesizing protein B
MAMLHTINKSPFDRSALESCIRLAADGSAVLLIEDGVYGAMKGTQKAAMVENAMGKLNFYVLGPDVKARGIADDKLIDGIKVVDYDGFVDLVTENDSAQSWL